MLDQGVWAEVKVGDENLRLFSERNALGVQASVYNVNAKNWIAPSELVEDIEQGKDRAAAHARAYLRHAGNLELPPLEWKKFPLRIIQELWPCFPQSDQLRSTLHPGVFPLLPQIFPRINLIGWLSRPGDYPPEFLVSRGRVPTQCNCLPEVRKLLHKLVELGWQDSRQSPEPIGTRRTRDLAT